MKRVLTFALTLIGGIAIATLSQDPKVVSKAEKAMFGIGNKKMKDAEKVVNQGPSIYSKSLGRNLIADEARDLGLL